RTGTGDVWRPVGGSALLRAHHDGCGFFRAAAASRERMGEAKDGAAVDHFLFESRRLPPCIYGSGWIHFMMNTIIHRQILMSAAKARILAHLCGASLGKFRRR